MHHCAHCFPWHLAFLSSLSLILHSVTLHHRHISPFASPCSLYPRFFISAPLTVPWHSKALFPSLTLIHGAADDNNWFENRRQWDTRIIPGSHPPPPPPLPCPHPTRTLLLCIPPPLPVLITSRVLSFLVPCFIIACYFFSLMSSSVPNPFKTFFKFS